MPSANHFDVIVVGAGIFGSCAAFHSQKLGQKTLLIEQFTLNHSCGSSHGQSRIIRNAHVNASYVPLVQDSYKQIEEFEKKTGEKLWKKTGLLWTAPVAEAKQIASVLESFNLEHTVFKGEEIQNKYPQFKYDNTWAGIVDPMGGIIFADKWMKAFQAAYLEKNGKVHQSEEVISYHDEGEGKPVTVTTSKDTYTANKVIFTLGSWIGKFFPKTPMKVQAESIAVCYWKTRSEEDADLLNWDNFPAFITKRESDNLSLFAMPSVDYPNTVKFVNHHGDPIEHGGSIPDGPSEKVNALREYLAKHVPILESKEPVIIDKCKYTNSEDNHYVIDFYPGTKNIIIGGCGSGAGFKVAPCIGRVTAEMAAGLHPSVDVSFFSFDRFQKAK